MAISGAPLTLSLFGPLSVLVEGQPMPHLRSRKALWVLCLLALRHGRPVQREWLAGTLWPDVDQTQAYTNLRPALSELRKALGSEGARLQAPSRNSLLLDLTDATVDVIAFDAAMARKTPADLERAVSLYQGILLEDCTEEWVGQDREARHQSCLQALQELASLAAEAGNHKAAAGYWRRAVSLSPLWEAARRGLIEALIGSGDSNEARDVYRTFARQLRRDDPKAIPDEETTILYKRLLAAAHKRSNSPTPCAEATRVPAVSGYLPQALTPLVGREDECLEIMGLLQRSRLVTLTGPGGIGKTRLALSVASEVVGDHRDGVWLAPLDSLPAGTHVIGQIAGTLQVKESAGKTLLRSVIESLQGKRLLLVLDNCEHVLPACLDAATHLLAECAGLRILATSREAMGITGETVWAVPPLAVPERDHLPQGSTTRREVLLGYDSVKLFVERARAVQKTFTLTTENALCVAQLCATLEGIPLAIELAAGRVRALTVEQITEHLQRHLGSLRLLTGGSSSASHRQKTLRGALDWSFDLLSEAERTLLARLTVFAGGWDLEAAEEVCQGEKIERHDVLDLLSSLVDKSLVVFGQTVPDGEGRFRLLEMVRQYCAEKLAQSGTRDQIRTQHKDWYLALAEEAKLYLTGSDQQTWLKRLETEHDNLREALQWCTDEASPISADAGLRLASALWGFWEVRGYFAEGREHLERALAQDRGQAPTLFRARALTALGAVARLQGSYAAARTYCDQAVSIHRALGNLPGIADTVNQLGNISFMQRDYFSAKAFYEESLRYWRESNDRRGIALTLNNLGNIAGHLHDRDAATALYEESLQIRRELGDMRGIAYALRSLGTLAIARGDYAAAQVLLEEALRLRWELGNESGIAESLLNLGVTNLSLGNYPSALELFEQSANIHQKLGDTYNRALCLGNQAQVHYLQGNYASAWALYTESLNLRREIGDQYGTAVSLQGLSLIALVQVDLAESERLVRESLILFTNLEVKEGIAECLRTWGTLNEKKQEMVKAVHLYGAAEALHKSFVIVLAPWDKRTFERQVEIARTALGETVFSLEWEAGLHLEWKQAVAYALDDQNQTVAINT